MELKDHKLTYYTLNITKDIDILVRFLWEVGATIVAISSTIIHKELYEMMDLPS